MIFKIYYLNLNYIRKINYTSFYDLYNFYTIILYDLIQEFFFVLIEHPLLVQPNIILHKLTILYQKWQN